MKKIILFVCICIYTTESNAQRIVKGLIRDMQNKQAIPGAAIVVGDKTVTTDAYGFFALTAPEKSMLKISVAGYISKDIQVTASENLLMILLDPDNTSPEEVQVTGLYNLNKTLYTPGAVGTVTAKDIQRTNGIRLENSLNLIPGVRVERRTEGGGSRIVMRGYGNQINFNGSGYKAYYNEMPVTDADGTTLLDDIDLGTLNRIEVFKGPSSSIFGSGIAGVVSMYSEKAPQGITVRQSLMSGSNGMLRTNTAVGVGDGQANIWLNYGYQSIDGFRLHNDSKKNFFTLSGDFYASEKRTLSVFAAYTGQMDHVPGELNRRQLHTAPDSAQLSYMQNNAHVGLESFRMGILQEYRFNKRLSNKTSVFAGSQNIDQSAPGVLNKINKNKFGLRSSFVFTPQIGNVATKFILGAELMKDISYQKAYALNTGVPGILRTDLEVTPLTYTVFSRIDLTLAEGTLMTFGSSLNFLEYAVADQRPATGGYVNTSGYKRFTPVLAPHMAINHFLNKARTIAVYTSYSRRYAPPATNQVVVQQTGKVNLELTPEIGDAIEVCSKGSFLNKTLNYEWAFFNMDVRDKFGRQNFRAAGGQPAYTKTTNAGAVNYSGIELSLNYAYVPKSGYITLVRPFFAYTYRDFVNSDLKSDNNNDINTKDYTNKKVSGIAPSLLNGGIDLETATGFYLNLTDLFTDKMPIVLDNTEYADAYNLLNGRLGWRKQLNGHKAAKKWLVDLYAGMDNITGQTYSTLIFINQPYVGATPVVPGTSQASFFNPASPNATWYAGCSIHYSF
ncbi:MAG: hypothetical protein NVS3B15_05220 [Sediminibacterium sp.]